MDPGEGGRSRYRLQIARSRLFIPDSIVIVDDRPRPEAVVTVTEEGAFYWRVATIGKGNVISEWSPTRRFKVLAGGQRSPADPTALRPSSSSRARR